MWITFINIQNLSLNAMSILSDILLQINENRETIIINKENFKSTNKLNQFPVYFATVPCDNGLTMSEINDPLKIIRLNHVFTKISKDLFDRFRLIGVPMPDYKILIKTSLIINGFQNYEKLAIQIYNLLQIYKNSLQGVQCFSCNCFILISYIFKT